MTISTPLITRLVFMAVITLELFQDPQIDL